MLLPYFAPKQLEAGCDEAGRGCLAGPVFASAVILPENFRNEMLDDSKKLSAKQRQILRIEIEKNALSWAVAMVDNDKIDEINILNASILAMHLAIRNLDPQPEFIIVDGNRFKPYDQIPHCCIVKGDGIYSSIAAASVLAKTHRDDFMLQIHKEYPHYLWSANKGYPTKHHRQAIIIHGITPYHRKSFRLNEQLKLFF
jgi:ribonuclease HII